MYTQAPNQPAGRVSNFGERLIQYGNVDDYLISLLITDPTEIKVPPSQIETPTNSNVNETGISMF